VPFLFSDLPGQPLANLRVWTWVPWHSAWPSVSFPAVFVTARCPCLH
jgi:hypothetical protein